MWLEAESSTRHEFLSGEIFAMAGGTPEHAAMAAEVIGQFRLQGGPCRVFTSDLGVRVMATGLATYPDACVVCGPTERDPDKKANVTTPRVLVEVTSDGTENYDRGEKLEHYKKISSLECVVIVAHREARVDVWSRPPGSLDWSHESAGPIRPPAHEPRSDLAPIRPPLNPFQSLPGAVGWGGRL
jgi:Uma2 family endonuclease